MKSRRLLAPFAVSSALLALACSDDNSSHAAPRPDAGGHVRLDAGLYDREAGEGGDVSPPPHPITALFVIEGLRADQLSATATPKLWQLAQAGVIYAHAQSSVPSNSMAAAATLATGASPGRHGVLGGRLYLPGRTGQDSAGRAFDSTQPLWLADHGTLESLESSGASVLRVPTFFQVAQDLGLTTAVVGRTGPASLFDIVRRGIVLDDDYASPHDFAFSLQDIDDGMPNNVQRLFPDIPDTLRAFRPATENDVLGKRVSLVIDSRIDPTPRYYTNYFIDPTFLPSQSVYAGGAFLERAALQQLIRSGGLDVLVYWLREPGESALRYGPGSPGVQQALRIADGQLDEVISVLPEGSNFIVTSDGGTSALAGDARMFPRWALAREVADGVRQSSSLGRAWVKLETPGGVPVDGAVRLVDLLGQAHFKAYDGEACLSGHAYSVYSRYASDANTWSNICVNRDLNPKTGELTGPALVPSPLDPQALVVASNGSAELLYIPSHDAQLAGQVVQFLQSRPEIGAIFGALRYAALPGVFSLASLGFEDQDGPDFLITYAWDAADPVSFDPFVNAGRILSQPLELYQTQDVLHGKVCREGLYATKGPGICVFCPSDRPATDPDCGVSDSELSAARAASVYRDKGEFCEKTSVCKAGLQCTFGVCLAPGKLPGPEVSAAPADFPRGSSYGAMAGVNVLPGPVLQRDTHGVRGGTAPAELGTVLILSGPAFKTGGVKITSPAGLADVAPTLLHVLQPGLETKLTQAQGRVLREALADGGRAPAATAEEQHVSADGIALYSPTRPSSNEDSLLTRAGKYSAFATFNAVSVDGMTYHYLVSAGATRDGLTCSAAGDCATGVCSPKGVCLAAACDDHVKNGSETGVDCGGQHCPPCAAQ